MNIHNFKHTTILLIFISFLRAEWYYSPGIQLGLTSNRKLFYSTQLTIGASISDLIGSEPTFLMEWVYPGITVGARLYTNSKIKRLFIYHDLQVAMFGIAGYGLGYLHGKNGERYKKKKIWIGIPFIPFSFEIVDFLENGQSPSGDRLITGYGIFGLATMPFDGWPSW